MEAFVSSFDLMMISSCAFCDFPSSNIIFCAITASTTYSPWDYARD
jgi:hypothetical protein